MLKFRLRGLLVLVAVLLTPRVCPAQFSDDARWVPSGANCVVLVSGERIFSSELAKNQSWSDINAGAFDRGTSVLPPKVERMVVASQFDLSYLTPIWTVSVISLDSKFGLSDIAAKRNRPLDSVAERNALVLPSDVYLVQLDNDSLGAMVPADRQQLTRWVESASNRSAIQSSYISEAFAFADRNSDITIAFDLNSAVSSDAARTSFMNFDSIRPANVERAAMAASRLRGFMLGITIRDKVYAALRVDFLPGTVGVDLFNKATIIEALENRGVMIDEINDWEFSREAGTLMLKGTLSESGLRQINSLVAQPVQSIFRGIGSEVASPSDSQSNNPEVATRRYLNRIELIFQDFDLFLRRQNRQAIHGFQRWFSANAEQIDMLPTENVNPEILEFGARVSEGFRDISQILIEARASTISETAAMQSSIGGNVGNLGSNIGAAYGFRHQRPNRNRQRRSIEAENFADAKTEVSQIMAQLRNDLGNVRRNFPTGN